MFQYATARAGRRNIWTEPGDLPSSMYLVFGEKTQMHNFFPFPKVRLDCAFLFFKNTFLTL